MDLKAIIIDEEQEAQDEVLKALLSDMPFNEFDPALWISAGDDDLLAFPGKAFPILARYHLGKELDELIRGREWLTNLDIPSKRHESAHVFQMNPARNLTILNVITKLQFSKVWGSAMLQYDPACCIYNEIFRKLAERRTIVAKNQQQNISSPRTVSETEQEAERGARIDDPDLKLMEQIMLQDFGTEWRGFGERNSENSISTNVGGAGIVYSSQLWISDLLNMSSTQIEDLCKQAMSAFLVNSSNTDAYGRYFWRPLAVIESWTRTKDQRGCRSIIAFITEELINAWTQVKLDSVGQNTSYGRLWETFSDNIWSFCLAVGCPKADRHDPFKSLEMLRDLVSRQFVYTADLHNRISDLNKQIILQQRMITALAYRNVLEHLSAETPGNNATKKWHDFVDKMFRNVENGKIHSDNPFDDLFDQHKIDKKYPPHHLQEMAKELYSTLSRTIHNFQPSKDFDQYTPMPGQFDPMQIDFMTAMKPLRKNLNDDGNPIWGKERARYPGQVVDVGQTAEPKKQTKTVNEVKEPVSATDGILFAPGPDLGDLDSGAPVERSQTGQSAISGEDSESEEGSSRFWA